MKKTGDEYFDSEEFREMLDSYENAVSSGQPVLMDADELAEIADYYQMTDQAEQADAAIELALSLAPGATMPLIYKIHEALYYGHTDEADQLAEQIIDKTCPDYVYVVGEIMLAKGQLKKADAYFRAQFAHVAQDEYQDFIIDVASIFEEYGYAEEAMKWVKNADKEDSAEYKELVGRTLFSLGKYKDSEKLFNELIDTDPFSKRYWNELASAQMMNEDFSNAIQSSEYAIAIDPNDPDGLISKANALYRLNNFEEALEYYRRYNKEIPNDEFALMHQGTCLVNLERPDEAVAVLEEALEKASEDSPYLCDIYQELAFAYAEKGMGGEAIDCLDKTEQFDCDHTQILVVKGHILLSLGKLREAEACYHKAVKTSDTPNQTLMRVIVSVYDNKYVDTAYKLFKRYFQLMPEDNTEGYAYMALCCYDLKRWDEFLWYLKKACELNPRECRLALNHLFPIDLECEKYYDYIVERLKK